MVCLLRLLVIMGDGVMIFSVIEEIDGCMGMFLCGWNRIMKILGMKI